MGRIFFIFFLLSTILGSLKSEAQQKEYSKEVLNHIEKVENNLGTWVITDRDSIFNLQERMKFYNVPGLSIAVINNYQVEWTKGYGWADVSEKRPVNDQTLFQAASISKSLNALGVLKLVEDKKLDLFTDINQYLVSWKFPYDSLSKNKKITLAHLLSHTAGLSGHGFPGYAKGDSLATIIQILDGIRPANTKAIRSLFEPGLKFKYSGGGTTISQLIVMNNSKMDYPDYMQKNILDPLGMKNSFYGFPSQKHSSILATGYNEKANEISGKYHLYPEQGAASLWTNPAELARFIIETQLSLEGRSNKLLNREKTKFQLTPYIDSNAAMGVFVVKMGADKYFQHGGSNEGFRCVYFGSMEKGKGVVVMVNSDNGGILNEVVNSVARVYGWEGFYKPVKKILYTPSADTIKAYLGTYNIENTNIEIIQKPDGLWLTGPVNWKLYFTSEKDFFVYENQGKHSFTRDDAGNVTGILLNNSKAVKISK